MPFSGNTCVENQIFGMIETEINIEKDQLTVPVHEGPQIPTFLYNF